MNKAPTAAIRVPKCFNPGYLTVDVCIIQMYYLPKLASIDDSHQVPVFDA
jgi:hypothetical protein